MKKIIFVLLMLCLALIFASQVKASSDNTLDKLYIMPNDYLALELDGYKLLDEIDLSRVGIYELRYIDNNNKIYQRTVEVISKEVLEEGFIELSEDSIGKEDKIIKWVTSNIYLKEIKNNYSLVINNNNQEEIINVMATTSGNIVSCIYDEDNEVIYGCGNVYNPLTNSIDIMVFYYLINTHLFKKKTIGSIGFDEAIKMIYYDNNLYVVGTTTSSDGIFEHEQKGVDSFLLKVNTSLFVEKYWDLGVTSDDTIKDFSIVDNKLIILYTYVVDYLMNELIEIDLNLDNINIHPSGMFRMINKTIWNKEYLLISEYDDYNKKYLIKLFKYSKLNGLELIHTISKNSLNSMDLSNNNNNLILTVIGDQELEILILSRCGKLIVKKLNIDYGDKVFLNDNKLIIEGDYTYHLTIDYFILFDYGMNNYKDNYHPKAYTYLNNSPSDKSNITINNKVFGLHKLKYVFEGEMFDVVFSKDIWVDFECSVKNKNIYMPGMSIISNGDAVLNGEKIPNNYEINDVGLYTLIVKGMNDLRTIHFEIKNVENDYVKDQYEEIEFKNKELISSADQMKIINSQTENKAINKEYKTSLWVLMIPLGVSAISLSLYLMIGKRFI